ncbi:hypothetical protein [Halosimplex salinum]|uniref:hypothetical protein n=1 Tax=Halosimplex salinum TaxID=1710538 RepID=UPI000F475FCB|nr:hypothetical protein [Halosimplex salinum]
MYVEADFLLALIKDEDWLGDAAETVYYEHSEDLWTSQFTLVGLLLVAYWEDRFTGSIIYLLVALSFGIPYVAGILAGFLFWSELLPLRFIF